MRIINLMTFVCMLLMLALIPALVQLAQVTGAPKSVALALVAGGIAVLAVKRE